ncbi:YkyB family protein [Halobacillus naozhouensis]|uniref:YkyB family protein n=1 Tax=Halobacillus naozhouensis TaxID=554880 RepID=A0ABY8J555_9BACI|nr:YkyB family protein [Halobacillus naozhouensis]WFT76568.1 YkyB family protein [Halobacillus naozhouensis]
MREKQLSNRELAESLFIVNRHAKTAPEPKHLYEIKKSTITKLLKERRAKKIGLHFSDHPKLSKQHSTLLIEVGGYYFHIPAEKKDFNQLKHLGKVDQSYRNPKPKLSLSRAKRTLYNYLGWDRDKASTSYSPSTHSNLSMLGQQHIAPWNQRPKR